MKLLGRSWLSLCPIIDLLQLNRGSVIESNGKIHMDDLPRRAESACYKQLEIR